MSENRKKKYAAHSVKIKPNKIKRIIRHLKKQPKDLQSTEVLQKLQ